MHVALVFTVFAVIATGCGDEPVTQLVVFVATDMSVPSEMDAFRLRVLNSSGDIVEDRPVPVGPGRTELPASFGIAPREGKASERVTVEVDANRGGIVLFTTHAVTGFVEGRVLRLDMFLASRCLSETCAEDETCRAEGCVDPEIDPANLPGLDEDCDRDGDGHDSVICGGDDCDDGQADVHPGAPDPPAWTSDLVDDAGEIGEAALSVGPDGVAHVAYVEGEITLKYANNADGAWSAADLGSPPRPSGPSCDVIVDRAGDVHVSSYEVGAGLQIDRKDGDVWSTAQADAAVDAGLLSSLAVGDDDTVHALYTTGANELRHLEWLGPGSEPDVHPAGGEIRARRFVSLGVIGDTQAVAAYQDSDAANLIVVRFEGGATTSEVVDEDGDVGEYASVAVDDLDRAHLAYLDRTDGALRHAYSDAPDEWTFEVVADDAIARHVSIATFENSAVAVSFVAESDPAEIRFARRLRFGWDVEAVAAGDATSSSLAFAPGGAPVVAYVSGGDLHVAVRTSPVDRDCDGEDD